MKKILYIFMMSSGFIACTNKKTDLSSNREMVVLTDSTSNSSYLTDTGAVSNPEAFFGEGPVVSGKATIPEKKSSNSSNNNGNVSSSNNSSGTTAATGTSKKKGLSQAAKGTIIGGVGGALAGGVIGKNAKGAVIGGAIGAAGGYVIGRQQDKKSGRVGN